MGFGILFIGYVAAYIMSLAGSYGCFPAIIGCIVMMYALTKLIDYEQFFKYAFFSLIPLTLCTGYKLFAQTILMFGASLPGFWGYEITQTIFAYGKVFSDLLFNSVLFIAIYKIAKATEVEKIQRACIRNIIFFTLYSITGIVNEIYSHKYIFMAAMIIYLVTVILNCVCLCSCYMRICDESDKDMTAKRSKIEAINKFRDEFDKKEEKARVAQKEYHMQKIHKRLDRIEQGKKRTQSKKKK